ncbi:SURF1 family protein [Pseudomonas sp. UL073]|uniref:SURF1-like protein n=1 Tax=Zestomonas insulae TaxID=2809017 RepID=A0ABS2IIV2_9GAMM|nr:SURF1 family protein [Pseudomonas insulae]MBM7062608.1 SURF1 family protein [Pseudomonas insulae]
MSRFRPGVLPSLIVLALLPVLIGLGFWQLARAEEKRQLLASYEARRQAEPMAVAALERHSDPAFRRVVLHGQFDAQHSLLLDNRIHQGQVGVELLQPFYDQASDLWVLLNRGWLPWPDRRTAPTFTTPDGAQTLTAWVYVPPGATFQLHSDPTGGDWPRLVTAVDPAALWQQLGRGGLSRELRLEGGAAAYLTDWPIIAMGPEKHTGYAVQWFALAAALCGLFVYFGLHNGRRTPHGRHYESHQHS